MIQQHSNKETRAIKNANIRAITTTGTTERFIEGYAALFNEPSKLIVEYRNGELIEYTEFIDANAFDNVLVDPELNVIHTIDHDPARMVARTKSGTLQLNKDEIGLMYRFSVPNTSDGNDLYELISRGDLFESSFVFVVSPENGDRWVKNPDGSISRHIQNIALLYDTSTVINGAYENTKVSISRSLPDGLLEEKEPVQETDMHDANTINADFEISLLKSKKIS